MTISKAPGCIVLLSAVAGKPDAVDGMPPKLRGHLAE